MSYPLDPTLVASNQHAASTPVVRKSYTKPEITHELKLETRAGSTDREPEVFMNPFKKFDPRPRI